VYPNLGSGERRRGGGRRSNNRQSFYLQSGPYTLLCACSAYFCSRCVVGVSAGRKRVNLTRSCDALKGGMSTAGLGNTFVLDASRLVEADTAGSRIGCRTMALPRLVGMGAFSRCLMCVHYGQDWVVGRVSVLGGTTWCGRDEALIIPLITSTPPETRNLPFPYGIETGGDKRSGCRVARGQYRQFTAAHR
jgi:hypothetical protein